MIPARITAVLLVVPVFGRSGVTVVVVVSGAGVTVVSPVVTPVVTPVVEPSVVEEPSDVVVAAVVETVVDSDVVVVVVGAAVVVTFDFEFTPTANVLQASDAVVERYFSRTVCDDHVPNVFTFDGQLDAFLKSSPVKSA